MLITRSHIKLAWEWNSRLHDWLVQKASQQLHCAAAAVSLLDKRQWTKQEFRVQRTKKKRHRRTNFKFYTRMHDWKRVFNVDCPHNLHATAAVCEMRRKAPSRGFCNSWQDRQEKHKSDCVCNRKRWLNIELFAGRFCSFYSCRIKVRLVEGILVL